MAKIKHSPGIESMIGARGKRHKLVERQKKFKDYNGNITKIGRLEAYEKDPRNYARPDNFIRAVLRKEQLKA